MADLLPINATAQERSLSQVIDDSFAAIPLKIRDTWSPQKCSTDFLPFLAWAFSVDEWQPDWPEHIKRGVIGAAISNHHIKGTRKSVEDVVAGFGSDISVTEWFEMVAQDAPYTFEAIINYNGETVGADLQNSVIRAIDRTKPVRSHYTLQTGISASRALNVGGALKVTQYIRLEFEEQ